MYTYPYPRPAVTADVVVLAGGREPREMKVLLVRRKRPPFEGRWALPGGFLDENETLEHCAARELAEETGLEGIPLEQLAAFSEPGRDPRGHTVSVAFLGSVESEAAVRAGDDAAEARWWPVEDLPPLAFDHDRIIAAALECRARCRR